MQTVSDTWPIERLIALRQDDILFSFVDEANYPPLVVLRDGRILDGEMRYHALKRKGVDRVRVEVMQDDELYESIIKFLLSPNFLLYLSQVPTEEN